jgi:hypothetical protein
MGCRGSGKTYSIVRMLLNQEKSGFKDPITGDTVYIHHILFSPTAKSNPVFTALKYLDEEDIINDYTDLKLIDVLTLTLTLFLFQQPQSRCLIT